MTVPHRFTGKTAIVTGSAHGIGNAIARRLASEGANIALFDLLESDAAKASRDLPGSRAWGIDVTDDGQVAAGVEDVLAEFGRIDIVVNNAGGNIVSPRPFWEFERAEWDMTVGLNLSSQWLMARETLPHLRREGDPGTIINIASSGGIAGVAGMAAYTAAKAGVINLTKTMSKELGMLGIRVNAIAPGYIRFTRQKGAFTAEQVEKMEQQVLGTQSLKRIGQPEDIAAAVAFLASSDAAQITGQTISIDGALTGSS